MAAIGPVRRILYEDGSVLTSRSNYPVKFSEYHPVVRPQCLYTALNRLEKLGHPEVRFSNEEDLGHFTWVRVYEGRDLYDWFLAHSR